MELNLKNREELPDSLRRTVYETQVRAFPCLNTCFDERTKVIDRDHECHTHEWLFNNVCNSSFQIGAWNVEGKVWLQVMVVVLAHLVLPPLRVTARAKEKEKAIKAKEGVKVKGKEKEKIMESPKAKERDLGIPEKVAAQASKWNGHQC